MQYKLLQNNQLYHYQLFASLVSFLVVAKATLNTYIIYNNLNCIEYQTQIQLLTKNFTIPIPRYYKGIYYDKRYFSQSYL